MGGECLDFHFTFGCAVCRVRSWYTRCSLKLYARLLNSEGCPPRFLFHAITCSSNHCVPFPPLVVSLQDVSSLLVVSSPLDVSPPSCFAPLVGFRAQLIGPIQLHVKRQNSSICKFFQDIAWTFFLSVSGKICHSPIKKVKRQPTVIISFSQHSPFFGEQSKNPG